MADTCTSCVHECVSITKEPCKKDGKYCWKSGYPNYEPYEPREPAAPKIKSTFLSPSEIDDMLWTKPPAIPPGEEGGREMPMQKTPVFQVVLVNEPTAEEARERSKIGERVYANIITARDRDAALVKAMAELAADEKAPPYFLDMLSATVVPLRAE